MIREEFLRNAVEDEVRKLFNDDTLSNMDTVISYPVVVNVVVRRYDKTCEATCKLLGEGNVKVTITHMDEEFELDSIDTLSSRIMDEVANYTAEEIALYCERYLNSAPKDYLLANASICNASIEEVVKFAEDACGEDARACMVDHLDEELGSTSDDNVRAFYKQLFNK